MTIRVISSTMGVSTPATAAEGTGWYRYRGKQPDVKAPPSDAPQNRVASAAKRERTARYARLRIEGMGRDEAGAAIGVSASTARYYERDFQDQQRREARDA